MKQAFLTTNCSSRLMQQDLPHMISAQICKESHQVDTEFQWKIWVVQPRLKRGTRMSARAGKYWLICLKKKIKEQHIRWQMNLSNISLPLTAKEQKTDVFFFFLWHMKWHESCRCGQNHLHQVSSDAPCSCHTPPHCQVNHFSWESRVSCATVV